MVGKVGYDRALKAPLFAQNCVLKGDASACPNSADAVVRSHYADRAFLDRITEWRKIYLAERLLAHPTIIRISAGFRFGNREVFYKRVSALRLESRDYVCDRLARKQRVFAVVLEVAPAERRSVDIAARTEHAVHARNVFHLFSERASVLVSQPLVPSLRQYECRGIARALDLDRAVKAARLRRTVVIYKLRLAHRFRSRRARRAYTYHAERLVAIELIE